MAEKEWLNLTEKALEQKQSVDMIRKRMRQGELQDRKKVGNRWLFKPESKENKKLNSAPPANSSVLMDIDESDRHKKHYDALKSEGEYRKIELQIKQIEGELVIKADIESEYADVIVTFRNKVLDLPSLLKQKCNELTQHQQTELLTLCEDLLKEMTEYKPKKQNVTKPKPTKPIRASQRKKRG